jgi:trimethylamine--corrinoid protein Co-methyltransferase
VSIAAVGDLSVREAARIHERSLDLLEKAGIVFQTPCALSQLESAGCRVDYNRNWVSLPRELVEWALTKAPRVVRLCARDPSRDVVLDGRRPHHTTDSQGVMAIDLLTGQWRESTAADLRNGLLFADALDKVEIVNVMVAANDVPSHIRTIRHFALAFAQTSKHVRTGVLHAKQVPFIVAMAKAVVQNGDGSGNDGFRPVFSVVDCTISPLMHDGPMTEACIELAKLNVPILVYPMPLAGGTSPVTLGGTLLLHNIEFLSGLVLFQVVNPGTPVIYGAGASQIDMHTGRYAASANLPSLHLALAKMARFYNLPVNLAGVSTASNELDAQYGHEATKAALLAYLAGADEIYSVGLLRSAQVLSLEKMVLDNHLIHQIEATFAPVLVDEAHLQAELIERVGVGGNYLTQRETREFTRREYMSPWPAAGQTMLQTARTEALEILDSHRPPELPSAVASKLESLVADAARELA